MTVFPENVALALYAVLIAGIVALLAAQAARNPLARRLCASWRGLGVGARAAVVAALACGVAIGGSKTNDPPLRAIGGGVSSLNEMLRSALGALHMPIALVEARTNDVAITAPTTNAVVSQSLLRRGTSEGGEWLELGEPVLLGTSSFTRVYASPAVLTFGSMRHPGIDAALPDGTGATNLVALRLPLGIVPEANWSRLSAPSRFWHEPTRSGHLFSWDGLLLDRIDDAPATVQVEALPGGDFAFRYDFSQAVPTNGFYVGAQDGAAAAEAMSVRGGATNGATVFRIDGAAAPDGVPLADVFAHSPVFELLWRNTAGLDDLSGDTDGDGLGDAEELALYGTDPRESDTDGDGMSDYAEVAGGTDPRNPDENGDMVADGISADAIAASGYLAEGAGSANLSLSFAMSATGNAPPPMRSVGQGSQVAGVFSLGGIPFVVTNGITLNLSLPPDETLDFKFVALHSDSAEVSASGGALPVVVDDGNGLFSGRARHFASGRMMAVQTARLTAAGGGVAEPGPCIHYSPGTRTYTALFGNGYWDDWKRLASITGTNCNAQTLTLTVADEPPSTASIRIAFPESAVLHGTVSFGADIHRCEAGTGGQTYCASCHLHNPVDWHGTGLSISPDRALLGVNTGESVGFSVSGDSYEQSPVWSIAPEEEGGAALVASGGSATVEAGSRTGVYTVTATAGSCSDSAEVIVYGVDYLTIEPDIDGYAEEIVHFSGMTPHPFDRTHSPVPDLHQPVFFKDVQTDLVAQPFEVDLVAHFTPDCIGDGDIDCEWSLAGDGVDGILTSEQSAMARFEPTSGGGVYRFVFECGSVSNSEAVLVLPLSGASVDEIITNDLVKADAFATNVMAKYNIIERNDVFWGIKWFYANNMGDYCGRPDNTAHPTIWPYNQVNSNPESNGFSLGACGTALGIPVRMSKFSNFVVGYACEKIGVWNINQGLSQILGTQNDSSARASWNAGVALAQGLPLEQGLSNLVRTVWTLSDDKSSRLWPNSATPDNHVVPDDFGNPDTQFTSPGFLYIYHE